MDCPSRLKHISTIGHWHDPNNSLNLSTSLGRRSTRSHQGGHGVEEDLFPEPEADDLAAHSSPENHSDDGEAKDPCSSSRARGQEQEETGGLRRSNRTKHQVYDTYNLTLLQDEAEAMQHHRATRRVSSDANFHTKSPERQPPGSSESRRAGHGVGKGGLKRESMSGGKDEDADVDMYSRVKRKRSHPGYYMESDDSISGADEYMFLHKRQRTTKNAQSAKYRLREEVETSVTNNNHIANSTTSSRADSTMRYHLRRSQRQHRPPVHLESDTDEADEASHRIVRTRRASHSGADVDAPRSNNDARTSLPRRGRRVVLMDGDEVEEDASKKGSTASTEHATTSKKGHTKTNGDEGQMLDAGEEDGSSSDQAIGRRLRRRNLTAGAESGKMNGSMKNRTCSTRQQGARTEEEEEDDSEEEGEHVEGRRYPVRERRQRMPFGVQINMQPRRPQRSRWSLSSPGNDHRSRRNRKHRLQRSGSTTSSSGSDSSGDGPNGGYDSDERRFQRRKAKSMNRTRNELLPMNFDDADVATSFRRDRARAGASLADVAPMIIDRSITFDSIGGNEQQIQALKESVVLPLLYGDLFQKLGIQPPRGLLFYGPPGTGKTLLARALANECSMGNRKVAFFMRKGADCLSKWVGEAERQLRLLFDQAYRMRPSIIFFDEFDGLAPVRSSRQDQIHASIVSTLLALIDGLDDRGEVIVIGATNRVDAIDPALRRPGRFDREFTFFPPDDMTRRKILKIHCSKGEMLRTQVNDEFLGELAARTAGYTGADLRAVVTEASLCALRRHYPQVYTSKTKLLIQPGNVRVDMVDFLQALSIVQPSSQRIVTGHARPLPPSLQELLSPAMVAVCRQLNRIFPYVPKEALQTEPHVDAESTPELADLVRRHPSLLALNQRSLSLAASQELEVTLSHLMGPSESATFHSRGEALAELWAACATRNPRVLLPGPLSRHLIPAVLHALQNISVYVISVSTLHASTTSPEEALTHTFHEALRNVPSIVYLPNVDQLWESISPMTRTCLLDFLEQMPPSTTNASLLLLATTLQPVSQSSQHSVKEELDDIPASWQEDFVDVVFGQEIFTVPGHTAEQREIFFRAIFLIWPFIPPRTIPQAVFDQWLAKMTDPLPEVPEEEAVKQLESGKSGLLTEVEERKLWDEEEEVLRKLRMCMRHIVAELGKDRRFGIFARPVDPEDVPDYYDVITRPMDFNKLLDNIDQHLYDTPETFEADLEQIYVNALEYNPASVPKSRDIRHRAHDLRDCYNSLCRLFTPELREECKQIKISRTRRKAKDNTPQESEEHSKPTKEDAMLVAVSSTETATAAEPEHRPQVLASSVTSTTSKCLEEEAPTNSKSAVPDTSISSPNKADSVELPSTSADPVAPVERSVTGLCSERMNHLLKSCVTGTAAWSYPQLEQLHSQLTLLVNHYRRNWDRATLLCEMEELMRQNNISI